MKETSLILWHFWSKIWKMRGCYFSSNFVVGQQDLLINTQKWTDILFRTILFFPIQERKLAFNQKLRRKLPTFLAKNHILHFRLDSFTTFGCLEQEQIIGDFNELHTVSLLYFVCKNIFQQVFWQQSKIASKRGIALQAKRLVMKLNVLPRSNNVGLHPSLNSIVDPKNTQSILYFFQNQV